MFEVADMYKKVDSVLVLITKLATIFFLKSSLYRHRLMRSLSNRFLFSSFIVISPSSSIYAKRVRFAKVVP